MLHEQKPSVAPRAPRSTIVTEGGTVTITAHVGRVVISGLSILPHEAVLLGSEIERMGVIAQRKAEEAAARVARFAA